MTTATRTVIQGFTIAEARRGWALALESENKAPKTREACLGSLDQLLPLAIRASIKKVLATGNVCVHCVKEGFVPATWSKNTVVPPTFTRALWQKGGQENPDAVSESRK